MQNQIAKSFKWSLSFTKKVVTLVTFLWFLQLVYSAIMIYVAVKECGDFSYLDTFIRDNGESFRSIVGVNLISKTIENVFKYNEGTIFGKTITPELQVFSAKEPEKKTPKKSTKRKSKKETKVVG